MTTFGLRYITACTVHNFNIIAGARLSLIMVLTIKLVPNFMSKVQKALNML